MALDAAMITGVLIAGPSLTWTAAIAIMASTARLALGARLLRPVLAW
jgi:hypothetical protein